MNREVDPGDEPAERVQHFVLSDRRWQAGVVQQRIDGDQRICGGTWARRDGVRTSPRRR